MQAFRDIAAYVGWEEAGHQLVMRAACSLPADLLLTRDALLVGSDAECLCLTEGPEALAALAHIAKG